MVLSATAVAVIVWLCVVIAVVITIRNDMKARLKALQKANNVKRKASK